MPKTHCKCGYFIDLSEIPSPNQKLIISDIKYDKFEGLVDAEEVFKSMHIVAECNECGRIYIFHNGFNEAPTVYKKEEL